MTPAERDEYNNLLRLTSRELAPLKYQRLKRLHAKYLATLSVDDRKRLQTADTIWPETSIEKECNATT